MELMPISNTKYHFQLSNKNIIQKKHKNDNDGYLISINEQRRFTSKGGNMTFPHGITSQASFSNLTLQIVWSSCLSQIPNIIFNCQKELKKGTKSCTMMLRHLNHQLTTFI
jgi:hypothetical protein